MIITLFSGAIDHVYDVPECGNGAGDDYMAIYETIDRKRQVRIFTELNLYFKLKFKKIKYLNIFIYVKL
jgi:hypothetical protein